VPATGSRGIDNDISHVGKRKKKKLSNGGCAFWVVGGWVAGCKEQCVAKEDAPLKRILWTPKRGLFSPKPKPTTSEWSVAKDSPNKTQKKAVENHW
jgi:hypothetical protein